MRNTTKWFAAAVMTLALLALATGARAQTPTPEGTVISNKARVTYQDANSNAYADSATASVTVGFQAGVDATTATATVTPASPSTGNEATITINNTGNGRDSVSVTTSAAAGLTITGYKIGATPYASLALLNAALATMGMAAGGNVAVIIVYDVAASQGGASLTLGLTATSIRTNTINDTQNISVQPALSGGVNVTPDGTAVDRLVSNGVQYSQDFTVNNTSNGSAQIDLVGSHTGAVITIVSVNGTAGTSASITLGASANQTVSVVYTVAGTVGATDSLKLTGTVHGTSTSDFGSYIVTVVKPTLTIAKAAYRDDKTTAVAGTVLPGEYIQYKVTVTNSGSLDINTVAVTDALPAQVTYDSNTPDLAGWTINEAGGTVSAALSGTLTAGNSRFFWIRVRIK